MVIVTHDARLAAQAHRSIHLADGRVVPDSAPLVDVLPTA
jgi:predicted ABC-type transport system involved in lysophospholipase L1 biosynthesis ATPase subunit